MGVWVWAPSPNPQSPIPNPQSPMKKFITLLNCLNVYYFITKD
jgi:hypothetical protein